MTKLLPAALAAAFLLPSCGKQEPTPPTPAPNQPPKPAPAPEAAVPTFVKLDVDELKRLFGSEPATPKSDNAPSADKVALGKALYHEKALSKNGNLSCASCHDLGNFGQDGKATSPGSDGKNGGRNAPTTLNAFRHFVQFWDGRALTIEDQAIGPVLNPIEHGVKDEAELVAKIEQKPELVAGFQKAFPGEAKPVTAANFQKAVGAFERTLVTTSRVDKFLDGDGKALSTEEKQGLKLFVDTGCIQCHTTRTFGGDKFQKLGVQRAYATADAGRFEVTKKDEDKFVFKVPSLLNVAKTGPWFHDGKLTSLAEVVKTMAAVQLGKDLKPAEVDAIVTFLSALTGTVPEGVAVK